ncbi:hypothetical protein [Planomicrobium sp. Y74]|uniref:hypothetical protein n=1 Tax=Planomicrobium sp. Y74 TaxID=2478977 RepID=UPI001314FFCC|nr:hypothetical protein [Planomicrobium sp. Y74]
MIGKGEFMIGKQLFMIGKQLFVIGKQLFVIGKGTLYCPATISKAFGLNRHTLFPQKKHSRAMRKCSVLQDKKVLALNLVILYNECFPVQTPAAQLFGS